MKFPFPMKILTRTTLLSWGVAVLAVAAFAFVLVPLQHRMLKEGLASKAQVMAASIQDVTSGALVSEDYSTVVDHCMEILHGDSAVSYIAIVRNDGFALTHSPEGWLSQTLGGAWLPKTREPGWQMAEDALASEMVFSYRYPLNYSAIEWGWIHVGLSLDSYHRNVQEMRRRTLLAGFACAALGLLGSILYARRLVSPLLVLRDSVQRLAAGDLSSRATVHSADEVEQLADSFNRMAASLQSSHQELQDAHSFTTSIFSSMNDALLVVSADGRIVSVNPAMARLVEWPENELLGLPLDDVLPGGLASLSQDGQEVAETRVPQAARNVERTLRNQGGESVPVLFSASLMHEEGSAQSRVVCVAVDLRERKREEAVRHNRDLRIRRQTQALAGLALLKELHAGDIQTVVRQIGETCAQITGVSRVGVWFVSEEEECLTCANLYEMATETHSSGTSLLIKDFPRYFAAVRGTRCLAADDARQDPRTFELTDSYLLPSDIHSALHAAVKVGGRTVGVVCLEQSEAPCAWTVDEQQFVGSLADMTALAIEARDRRLANETLQRRDAMLDGMRFASEQFLRAAAWTDCIGAVLGHVGKALGTSRVYMFENRLGEDGTLLTSQRFEWTSEDVAPQIDNPMRQDVSYTETGLRHWSGALRRGKPVMTTMATMTLAEHAILGGQHVFSLLAVPIFVRNTWWGFIGFDHCVREHDWLPAEVASLQAVADSLGAAIQKQYAQEEALRAKEEAEAASEAKSQFLANMSHEIRTPIGGVVGMLELLQLDSLTSKQRRFVETAARSSETLLEVIGDVLDFSKIEAGHLELDLAEFGLRDTVDTAIRLFAERAESKHLDLSYTIDPELPDAVVGDANRLRQVLTNLLGNGIKFTDVGEIHVAVALAAAAGPAEVELRFDVRDTGPGIPGEQLDLIFDSFAQGDGSMRRRHGGTGLGLSIARDLISMMGGKIWVESVPDSGATFHFTVRLGLPEGSVAPASRGLLEPKDMRVLVVDNAVMARQAVRDCLRTWGCTVGEAGDAPQALAALRRAAASPTPYAIAVVDASLPGTDGYGLAKLIRAEPGLTATRLILLSGFEEPPPEDLAASGILTTVPKPVRASDLYDVLVTTTNGSWKRPTRPVAKASGTPPIPRGMHILLAEDNEINQEVAREMIHHLGCSCTCLDSGAKALAATAEGDYDLILMDCQMPGMDGYEATGAIRAWEQEHRPGQRIPIVALTAHAMKGDRERCLAAGMDDYLTKPLATATLTTILGRWLKTDAPVGTHETAQAANLAVEDQALEAAVIARCSGVRALASRLLKAFVKQTREDLDAISAAIAAGDPEQVERAAHRLKGAAGSLALNTCQHAAAELVQLGRAGRLDGAEPHMATLRAEAERIEQLGIVQESV